MYHCFQTEAMINIIEIKARSNNHQAIRNILKEHQATFKGKDHQVDVYFNANQGRLKLRKGAIENNLIHYHRSNQSGPKHSVVHLYASKADSSLEKVLKEAMGIKVIVDKQREIYFIENVKFHIDEVKALGTFIEIEAIDEEGTFTNDELLKQCEKYLGLFQVQEEDLVSVSYSDLLLEKINLENP